MLRVFSGEVLNLLGRESMRKLIYFAICIIMLFSIGCSNNRTKSIGVSISDFQAQDIVMPTIADNKRNNAITLEMLPNEMDCIDVFDKVDLNYWGVKSEKNDNQELDSNELLVKLNPYQETSLQYPEKLPEWQVGSGTYAVMKNRYIYEWRSYTAGFDDQQLYDMKLTCLDAETGEVTIIAETQLNTPLVYLCSLDDTHFLSYYVIKTDSTKTEYATLTVAEIYSIDGDKNEIIREKYENDIAWSSSEGILIEIFAIKEGEIYGFGRQLISNEYSFYFYHYSKSGELLDIHKIPDIEKILGDEQPLELCLVGDYIVIRTYESLTTYICKQRENGLEYIAKGSLGSLSYAVSENNDIPYIFFMEKNVNEDATIKEKECPLYVLNTNTGEVVYFKIQTSLEKPYFNYLRILSNGDMLISYCESQYDPMQMKKFILKKEKMNQLLS